MQKKFISKTIILLILAASFFMYKETPAQTKTDNAAKNGRSGKGRFAGNFATRSRCQNRGRTCSKLKCG